LTGASRRPAASSEWANYSLAGGMLASLLTWAGADLLRGQQAPAAVQSAILDVIGHGAVAVYVALWVWPIWGWPAVIAAGCAAVLIDVDHALAAGSLLPDRMMGLGARPWPHSMLGVVLGAAVALRIGGVSLAYAVGVGMFTHVIGDATAWPGVPLLVPLYPDPHVLVPAWTLPVAMAGLSATGAVTASRARR
jgi:membrane-bound metal-dependent hydrolase YbcI (DUF457 family)